MTESQVCPVNIDAAGRRRRMTSGVIVLLLTLAAHVAFVRRFDRLWTLAEFPFLFFAWLGVFQALDRTCVVLAARGTQETDAGTTAVGDAALVAALKKRAVLVYVKTDVAAMVTVGLLYVFVPALNDRLGS